MSGALQLVREAGVYDPGTGEVVALDQASTDELTDLRDALTQLDYERREALHQVEAEIVARTDAAIANGELAQYSFDVGRWHVQVQSPAAAQHVDVPELWRELLANAERLGLAERAVNDLFVAPRPKHYLHRQRWATLVRLHPELEQLRALHAVPTRRTVKVSLRQPVAIDSTAEET